MTISTFLHDNFVPHIPKHPDVKSAAKTEALPENDAKSTTSVTSIESASTRESSNHLQRSLRGRHVQLLGIGATIGSALFVAIGKGLQYGPLNLFFGLSCVADTDSLHHGVHRGDGHVPTDNIAVCADGRPSSR
ncbi:hypothetical protein OXX59_004584 [Metschnikowia pulcherrima]